MHTIRFTLHQNRNMMQQILTTYEEKKRLQRLLAAIQCAVECADATVFHVEQNRQLLSHQCLLKLKPVLNAMHKWSKQVACVEQDIKAHLPTLLYMHPPAINIRSLPNRFEVADMLYHIGYYPRKDDYPFLQHPQCDDINQLLDDEIRLEAYCSQVFQALIQTEFIGDWKTYGTRISDLYMTQPQSVSSYIRILMTEKQRATCL